jgi:hypothetical protein
MADGGAGPPQRPAARGEALGLRLALAFLAVALAAVALLARPDTSAAAKAAVGPGQQAAPGAHHRDRGGRRGRVGA